MLISDTPGGGLADTVEGDAPAGRDGATTSTAPGRRGSPTPTAKPARCAVRPLCVSPRYGPACTGIAPAGVTSTGRCDPATDAIPTRCGCFPLGATTAPWGHTILGTASDRRRHATLGATPDGRGRATLHVSSAGCSRAALGTTSPWRDYSALGTAPDRRGSGTIDATSSPRRHAMGPRRQANAGGRCT